jgi:hypothetical protein
MVSTFSNLDEVMEPAGEADGMSWSCRGWHLNAKP